SMFEPVHGSAPDIAGKGVANPMAAVLSVAMLFDHLNLPRGAEALRGAVAAVLRAGKVRPPDLGGPAGTAAGTDAAPAARRGERGGRVWERSPPARRSRCSWPCWTRASTGSPGTGRTCAARSAG